MPFALSVMMRMAAQYKVRTCTSLISFASASSSGAALRRVQAEVRPPEPVLLQCRPVNTGHAIAGLGRYYARAAALSGLEFDMLFGPAYKASRSSP